MSADRFKNLFKEKLIVSICFPFAPVFHVDRLVNGGPASHNIITGKDSFDGRMMDHAHISKEQISK
jgi:hypothetical protein